MEDEKKQDENTFLFPNEPLNSLSLSNSLAVSSDGQYLLSGHLDAVVRLWELSTGRIIRTLWGHDYYAEVRCVAFSQNGTYAMSGGTDKIIIWEINTGKLVRVFDGYESIVSHCSFSLDCKYIVAGSYTGEIKIWELSSGEEHKSFKGNSIYVTSAFFSNDNKIVMTGHANGNIKIWNVNTGSQIKTIKAHGASILTATFSSDEQAIYSCCERAIVKIWGFPDGNLKKIFQLSRKDLQATSIAFSQDGRYILLSALKHTYLNKHEEGKWPILRSTSKFYLIDLFTYKKIKSVSTKSEWISAIAFLKDNNSVVSRVLSMTGDSIISLNVHSGKEILNFKKDDDFTVTRYKPKFGMFTETAGFKTIAFIPNTDTLLSGDDDGRLDLWDTKAGEKIRSFEGHTGRILAISVCSDGQSFLSTSDSDDSDDSEDDTITIRLWDINTGNQIRFLKYDASNIVSFSPDCRYALISGLFTEEYVKEPFVIILLNIHNRFKFVRSFKGHEAPVTNIAFLKEGQFALSGDSDGIIKLWNVSKGIEVKNFNAKNCFSTRWDCSFSNNGQFSLLKTEGGIILSELETGKTLTFKDNADWTWPFQPDVFSPDDNYFASSQRGCTFGLWETSSFKQIKQFKGHTQGISTITFSHDNKIIATSSLDSTIKIWSVAHGNLIRTLKRNRGPVRSVDYSSDGKYILTGNQNGTFTMWNSAENEEIWTYTGHDSPVISIEFSPDGLHVLSGGEKQIRVWQLSNGKFMQINPRFQDISSIAFSLNGKKALSGHKSGILTLWDISVYGKDKFCYIPLGVRGRKIRTFKRHKGSVRSVAFSPDGKTVLSGSKDGSLKLWDISKGGRVIRIYNGHKGSVNSVAFSNDGKYVLSGSDDETVRLWDMQSGVTLKIFSDNLSSITSVTFLNDSNYVLFGCNDFSIKLWNSTAGLIEKTFEGHHGMISSISVSPDGQSFLSGSWDGSAIIWNVFTGKIVTKLV